jgi:hypothetical protein
MGRARQFAHLIRQEWHSICAATSANCQTPILVLPKDVPGHPYAVAMETVRIAPNAQVSLYPWKASKNQIPLAVRHICTLLRAHRPAAAATKPLAPAAQ